MWKKIFKQLKVKSLLSTAYHLQTDESSEITNQTAEIALQYYLSTIEDINGWATVLPQMQAALNNSKKYFSTDKTSTEILFNFCIQEALDLLHVDDHEEEEEAANTQDLQEGYITEIRMASMAEYRSSYIDAKNTITFAAMCIKEYYDASHTPKYFKVGDRVNLQLHHRYTIPGIQNRKIQQQFVGPFKVTERIDQLTYRLDLLLH